MTLEQRIQEERNRVAGEIERLKNENQLDSELLKDLRQEYNAAVLSNDESELDFANDNIKQVSGRINRRNDKISAMEDKNNPNIQKMIFDEVSKWRNEFNILEQLAKDKYPELQDLKNKFVAELLELNDMKKRSATLRYALNYWTEQLNDSNKKSLGVTQRLGIVSPIVKQMRSLLITDGEVFK